MKDILRFAVLLIIVLVGISLPVKTQTKPAADSEQLKVYEAVLGLMDHIDKKDLHVTIFNQTLNSKCGAEAYPSPLANDCSFLWIKPDTADSVKELLRGEWTELESSTWSDFEGKNAVSVKLHEPISTPWPHMLAGSDEEGPKRWESPDLAIFLSQVGFNQKKTEAVVYVLIFSYMDQVATTGDYFLFHLDRTGHWKPNGRVTYFSIEKDQSPKEQKNLSNLDHILFVK